LVVFRGIQGLGAGGLFPLSLAVIGGIVPPRDRGRWQGLIGAVFASASIIGPAVGGFIVDNTTWRWIFLVNLPVGAIALVVIALTGTISYVPLFAQGVIGTSATSSGVVLTPLMLGAVTTSFLAGQLVSRTGRYRWNVVLGPPVLALGMALLWRMNVHTTNGEAARNMVVAGVGIGSMMQVFVLSVQNAVPRARIGSATALTQFSRQMGATIGVSVMGV